MDKKISDATTLIHINQYNTNKETWKKIEDVDKRIPDVSGLVTNYLPKLQWIKYITHLFMLPQNIDLYLKHLTVHNLRVSKHFLLKNSTFWWN